MWACKNIQEFCNDPDEWHGLVLGFTVPFFLWPFILQREGEAAKAMDREPWYVTTGMLGQAVAMALAVRRFTRK